MSQVISSVRLVVTISVFPRLYSSLKLRWNLFNEVEIEENCRFDGVLTVP